MILKSEVHRIEKLISAVKDTNVKRLKSIENVLSPEDADILRKKAKLIPCSGSFLACTHHRSAWLA
jgi:hypothetical protein